MNSTGTGYAGGSNGKMYTTSNSGTTWTQQTISGLTANITEMHFPDNSGNPSIGYATTTNGNVLKLNTFANTWDIYTPLSTALNGLYFSSISNGYAVGDGGAIITTSNSGVTWTSLTNVNFGLLKDVCFAAGSSTVGYAVGATGAIIKTINGGISWSTVTNLNTTDLNAVYFTDANVGIAVGNTGQMIDISGGGTSLTAHTEGVQNLNDIIYASNHWVSVGNNRTILIKNPTWAAATISGGSGENLFSVYFVGTTGYACGSNGAVYKTTDDGVNWILLTTTGTTEVLREIYFRDLLTGYAMGDNGTIIKTIDGGINWITETGIAGTDYFTAAFDEEGHALLAGSGTPNLNTLFDESNDHSSRFWYDRLGRLVVSQNGKQFNKTPKAYSYTKYDALGRITEVAETGTATNVTTIAGIQHGVIGDDAALATWLGAGTHTEITSTLYDVAISPSIAGFTQENLRKRVSSVSYAGTEDNNASTFDHATHYSYDIHGNVKTLVQDNPSLATLTPSQRYKKIDYIYDLVSGKVNQVSYQNGQPDAFYHQYEYDADNRITNVITSKDGVIWDKDANYFYYQHGPLARTELGDQKVQAMDYAYTIQGWIKGVNSNTLKETRDIGLDGETGSTNLNRNFARDAFGYSLNYFAGDYASIATISDNFIANTSSATYIAPNAPNLYNGNISSMVTAINDLTTPSAPVVSPQLTAYKYDQLNRINDMRAYRNINIAGNAWYSSSGDADSYKTHMEYDANGNILQKNENGIASISADMDELTYHYEKIGIGTYTRNTNKLRYVTDSKADGNYNTDIDGQASTTNYEYDEIGNLIADAQEQIANIDWTVYGKIKSITRTGGSTKPDLLFAYDASGNRVAKTMIPRDGSGQRPIAEWITTNYVRDAQGNVMSTYELADVTYTLKEQMLYGSSRLGTFNRDLNLTSYTANDVVTRVLGKKNFELSNHLGNVLSVTSDRKLAHSSNTTTIDYYLADIQSATDYYSFGAAMPGRSFVGANGYRYGFNGKENDNEVKGNGNSYDFDARIYDPRIGRWLSSDPKFAEYPDLSPYQFAGNSPILFWDTDGEKFVNPYTEKVCIAEQNVTNAQQVYDEFRKNNSKLSPKDLKKSQAAKNLNSLQFELAANQVKAKEVDDYLFTLETTNEKEYNYFETLKDAKDNQIDIVINLKGENLIDGNQAKTTGFASYPNPDGTKTPSAADNKFDVNLYEKGKGKSVELDYMSGRNYSSLANELGDIKYYMENVKDQTSLNFWKETSTSGTPGYQNPQGAGQKSSNYEKERVKDFKNYTPKAAEKKDNVKQVIKKE